MSHHKSGKRKHHSKHSSHSSHDHHDKHDHHSHHEQPHANCCNRTFQNESAVLRAELGRKQAKHYCQPVPRENAEENRYKIHNYNAEFTKGLQHDINTGTLVSNRDYEKLRHAVINNRQKELAHVPMAINAEGKFVSPLASLATELLGAPQCRLKINDPPSLASPAACELLENYAMAIARDVPFINYESDPIIAQILSTTRLNSPDVLDNLEYYYPTGQAITPQRLFRGTSPDSQVGPYISQLLLLDVPMGNGIFEQQYYAPKPRDQAIGRVEWGVNAPEVIALENTNFSLLPQYNPDDTQKTYIYNARTLAEAVHHDAAYQYFYQAANILLALGAPQNPGIPSYPNQRGFVTGFGGPNILCALAEATGYALRAAWYYKWQIFRRLRPEAMSLWVDNIKNGRVENDHNYNITEIILNNGLMDDINNYNSFYSAIDSYTLPQSYIEGSPLHPAYPAGHATFSGACATILKIMFDCNRPWSTLPGFTTVKIANEDGTELIDYTGTDAGLLTINGEINKLAYNVALGRNMAGVHYRSDGIQSLQLGEQVAMKFMSDYLSGTVENNLDGTVPTITFIKFDGTVGYVVPTICKK